MLQALLWNNNFHLTILKQSFIILSVLHANLFKIFAVFFHDLNRKLHSLYAMQCTPIFVRRKDKTNYLTWAKCYHSRKKHKLKTLNGGPYKGQAAYLESMEKWFPCLSFRVRNLLLPTPSKRIKNGWRRWGKQLLTIDTMKQFYSHQKGVVPTACVGRFFFFVSNFPINLIFAHIPAYKLYK